MTENAAMLVDAAWLAAHLGDPDLRVFDATKYLPTEGRDGAEEFARGHIPRARFFDIDLFADADTDLPHMAPTQGRFTLLAGDAGISAESFVVFYDQKGQSSAARGWWLMKLFGHDRVALLDGGLPAWRAAGGPIEIGGGTAHPRAVFLPRMRAELLAGVGDVLAANGTARVLDARPAGRFAGAVPEPRPGLASGHIPGSLSLPFTELLDEHGKFLEPEALRTVFAARGAGGGGRTITTCGTGVTAAIVAFALARAGLGEAAVYDGSWSEWGARADLPKETGSQRAGA